MSHPSLSESPPDLCRGLRVGMHECRSRLGLAHAAVRTPTTTGATVQGFVRAQRIHRLHVEPLLSPTPGLPPSQAFRLTTAAVKCIDLILSCFLTLPALGRPSRLSDSSKTSCGF